MSWGFDVRGATVGWGRSFDLEVGDLGLDAEAVAGRLPVLGRSGSGKSTLLYLLTFLKRPRRGGVRWTFPDGERAVWGRSGLVSSESTVDLTRLRRFYFGFAYQTSTLAPYLTVRENLIYPLQLQGVLGMRQMRQRAEEMVRRVLLCDREPDALVDEEVEHFLDRYPSELSGGQMQRVALAQAMVHNPYILFADEPTGNLDAATRKEVMAVVDQWLSQGNRLLIWVTHHLSDASDSRVQKRLVIAQGQCHLQGRVAKRPSEGKAEDV
ncbi:MAG: ATP-binding cassette domain-containing protein [Magnetococcus sp. WYHC-3]